MAIISHIGRNTDHGHYVCHVKKDGQWAFFNDEKVQSHAQFSIPCHSIAPHLMPLHSTYFHSTLHHIMQYHIGITTLGITSYFITPSSHHITSSPIHRLSNKHDAAVFYTTSQHKIWHDMTWHAMTWHAIKYDKHASYLFYSRILNHSNVYF